MAIIVQDAFTVGSDTALTSHTPTDAGTGYTMQSGTMTVQAASDDVIADSATTGHRAGADDSVGDTDMKVEGDFTFTANGSLKFFGVAGRKATAGGSANVELVYDHGVAAYTLGTDSYSFTWTGTATVNLRLECIGGTCYGYVDDVLRVQDTIAESGTYAGFVLGDFDDDGGGTGATMDNFLVETVETVGHGPLAGEGGLAGPGGLAGGTGILVG